jgi:hypothetical protein
MKRDAITSLVTVSHAIKSVARCQDSYLKKYQTLTKVKKKRVPTGF